MGTYMNHSAEQWQQYWTQGGWYTPTEVLGWTEWVRRRVANKRKRGGDESEDQNQKGGDDSDETAEQ
jgi:hypothetical protein